jgi:pimeloyl-ACP methyl ester carboxylesterase
MIHKTTIAYASRIDGLGPLHADVVFRADGRPKPLTAVIHGFHCTRGHVEADCAALAALGLFCVAPNMRGHGESAGLHDCGALQIADLVDALREAAAVFPAECDRTRINAVGYSGGGGNVFSLFTKFPELLQAGATFFGISDYALWHETRGRPDCNATMERAIGGTPAEVPARYAARSALRAVGNNPHTRLHVFWDEAETACPPVLNERFIEAAQRLGHRNVVAHRSRAGDAARWHHGYRRSVADLYAADAIFTPDFLAPPRPWRLPRRGELDVCGYVVTSRFAVWIGDGMAGHVRIGYDASGDTPRVEILDGAPPAPLRVLPGPTVLDGLLGDDGEQS